MKKVILDALEKSIEKWKKIISGEMEDRGPANCALCKLFHPQKCKGCPVFEESGFKYCMTTMYECWEDHHKFEHDRKYPPYSIQCWMCKYLAEKELKFLRSLLPNNFQIKLYLDNEEWETWNKRTRQIKNQADEIKCANCGGKYPFHPDENGYYLIENRWFSNDGWNWVWFCCDFCLREYIEGNKYKGKLDRMRAHYDGYKNGKAIPQDLEEMDKAIKKD